LIHTPSNIKNPVWIAKQAKKYANGTRVEVKSGAALKDFGGLRAVGGSSPKPGPRFIKMSYTPRKAKAKHVVLVGKGITYDTGGISLKRPYDLMAPMKSDMAGVAACLAAMSALKDLKANVKVTALLMCAENAISGTAQRPGDVITHYGGKTVEVLNTDAEGRLVLADGLAFAVKHLKPDYLVDIATLTGAASLGLGKQYAALYSRNHKWVKELRQSGENSGDRVWHMPLIDDYEIALQSEIADINHTADAAEFSAGSVTAALFLEQFVADVNWAHLDIAGVGRADSDAGENPKGGTGFGVRLLLDWIGTFK
jgi:leucyl aminopeptidase